MPSSLTPTQISKIAAKTGLTDARVKSAADDHSAAQLQADADIILQQMILLIDSDSMPADPEG